MQPQPSIDRFIRLAEVARSFGMDERTVAAQPGFPLVRMGPRRQGVWLSQLTEFIASHHAPDKAA